MRKVVSVVLSCVGLALGCGAAPVGAAPKSDQSATKECVALKKELGNKQFKVRFRDPDGRHAMQNCKAELGGSG
jgi:hypothetical protein